MELISEDDDSRNIIASRNPREGTQMKTQGNRLNNDKVSAGFAPTSRYGNVPEFRSIDDSGYGPSGQSFATTEVNADKSADAHPLIRAGSLPLQCHSDLFHFLKPVDEATENRFKEVIPVIEEFLRPLILSLPKPRLISIRPMFLGTDEVDIAPYIVILCKENYRQKIENLVRTPLVRDLCESPGLPLLKVLVTDPAPRPHFAQSSIEVCRKKTTTLCGMPILLVNKSAEAQCGETRKATVGGIIKITTADGKSKLYGMTAGHMLDDWHNASTDLDGGDSTETYEEFSTQNLAGFKDPPLNQISLEPQDVLSEAWDFAECDAFAEVLDNRKLAALANREIQPSHDWTLFTIKSGKPNQLCALTSVGHFERRELKEAAKPTFHDKLSDPVIMMGGSHGPKRGELSSLMGRILIGSSNRFVDAYILTLNDQGAIRDGDSGSWVVHHGSPLVFGHVVATDMFGGAYVIPMVDTFEDIKQCLGAVSVALPTDEDLRDSKTIEPSTIEALVTDVPTIESLWDTDPATDSIKASQRLKGATRVPSESTGNLQLDDQQQYVIAAVEENLNKLDRPVDETPLDRMSRPFLTLVNCEWNPVFATRREKVNYQMENEAYIEFGVGLGLEEKAETSTELGEKEGIVRAFMQARHELDVCADKVEAFCFGATLEALKAQNARNEVAVAWLDERSFLAGKGRARTDRGPLTARQLYRQLKKPRFRYGGPSLPSTRSRGAVATRNSNGLNFDWANWNEVQLEEPDAERRLIFITDLDRWSIYALIGTASSLQADALRDALYKHLAFENFIGVTFPPGFPMFQLAFHLPYYAWRASGKCFEDHRRDANANPLRQSQDVSFLNWTSSESSSFLYEAQISCVIAGSDESRWVAYCFVDTYFEVEKAKETVQSYYQDRLADGGMLMDPLTFGRYDADNPIWTPRKYFLVVFQARIGQVKREWEQVLAKVRESIHNYTHYYSIAPSRERISSKVAEEQAKSIRRSRDWVVQVRRLLKQLSQDLSKTVEACERFCCKYAICFRNLPEPANNYRLLATIQRTFDELELLKKTLESLVERCDNFARDLELQLIIESVEVSNLQHKISEDNKGLSLIMMLFIAPIVSTAGIFSMNGDVISFIPASFGSFMGLLFAFGVLGMVIYVVLQHQSWCWQVTMMLAGQKRWDKKMGVPRLGVFSRNPASSPAPLQAPV